MATPTQQETASPLAGRRVAFVGKLGGVTRREAHQIVRTQGGVPVDKVSPNVDWVVLGADELPLTAEGDLIDDATRAAAAEGRLEIVHETQFWQRLGLVESQIDVHRLYTPAMLADLLGVSVAIIRRWHRRGLIVPEREVRRLPYFSFQEVATARRLAELLAAGASHKTIEKRLGDLARFVPNVERPLAQLAVIVEGKQLLLRQGEGLIEPGGQFRIDFDALEETGDVEAGEPTVTVQRRKILPIKAALPDPREATPQELLGFAGDLEDEGQLQAAAELCRAALAAGGPNAQACFQLAELLYRMGDVTAARERYYAAVEIDEDYVEARANLGCVLAETGQPDLAVAAFQGTLRYHEDYPDVHFHLARTLDGLQQRDEAEHHWRRFLALAPDSPWAEEARSRLGPGGKGSPT